MQKTILITGATSGFGKAMAERFASAGWRSIVTGRREELLVSLAEELKRKYKAEIFTLAFDVQDKEAVFQSIGSLPPVWKQIDVLVNNAGGAIGRDNFADAELDDWEQMIDTNIKGLLYISKAVLPVMKERREGHIINIGSIAGKEVYENGNIYCASKHAVNAISKSMRIDLLKYNIKVTAIHPGAANTEFSKVRFKGDLEKAQKVYEGYVPLLAEDIASVTHFCASQPSHVCINDLVVTCTAQANSFYFHKS